MADKHGFSAREKQRKAANFKALCHTEKGRSDIRGFLDDILSLQHSFDAESQDWCLWLIASGTPPEEFKNVLRSFDSPTICGLVWNRNFVAYRCRDCGISPCMSLCADCFHAGNHEGHDFNMFKSQAGGACDCGDEDVMKSDGCVQYLQIDPSKLLMIDLKGYVNPCNFERFLWIILLVLNYYVWSINCFPCWRIWSYFDSVWGWEVSRCDRLRRFRMHSVETSISYSFSSVHIVWCFRNEIYCE